jgi:hypothetical protein
MVTTNEAFESAADLAISRDVAVVVRRDGHLLFSVVPDVLILELMANGIAIRTGTTALPRNG